MAKDHSDIDRWNPLLLFSISNNGSVICTIPVRIAHAMIFLTPVVEQRLEWEIAQWVHHEGSIWQPTAPGGDALPLNYVSIHNLDNGTVHFWWFLYYCALRYILVDTTIAIVLGFF